jgi:hypothetical protein
MGVWLKVDLPFKYGQIDYPYLPGRAGFGCNDVEVRRDGKLLPQIPGSNWMRGGVIFNGNICGSLAWGKPLAVAGRLPLHRLYRFDVPGVYEVRYIGRSVPLGGQPGTEFRVRSEWTSIEVLAAQPGRRDGWLRAVRERQPSDAGELLYETLPGLFGFPDEASLEILTGYLYHPDAAVRKFAVNGLNWWPADIVSRTLPDLIRTKGPNDDIERFLQEIRAGLH